ncbi:winged helix-turn-helix domain-containing protein [Enterovibrio norvegicus]|uniref:winged helix-turn-helix domain-containing protein n=1 Tax=Enterovibrio norvegicus TaxID=188144 RepID=UPI0013D2A609|nr:crosslink repair DNA glycosylase YcaQ family protein [Enterovibrio norvegicus]
MESLSLSQARKLILHSQQLPQNKQGGSALSATLSAIEQLGYIQIDTISVVQRAHHHTLWNRNPRYDVSHLDTLVARKQVFEYWSHAAAFLPMRDYRYSLPRKHAFKSGAQSHWYKRDNKMMDEIVKRIDADGPLLAKDFEGERKTKQGWGRKPSKHALENLFIQGDLMITARRNFHKVYDLTERVLPEGIDTSWPDDEEYALFLITRFLEANGLGNAIEMSYLLKNTKPLITSVLKDMVASGDILEVAISDAVYFALPQSLSLLDKPLAKRKAKILSPFDNLLIQRKRAQFFFDFDYLIECYVPEAKRQFGYFSLPVLWNGDLVARMDCKVDKASSTLLVLHLALEAKLKNTETFNASLHDELQRFAAFNGCGGYRIERTSTA